MEWAIGQVDPKKMIKTGSFRINPDGTQSTKDVKLKIVFLFFHFIYLFFIPHLVCVFISSLMCVCISQVPYARSEGHLLEVMEGVCDKMKDYGETMDPTTNRKIYVRFMAREGTSPDISNVSYDSRVTANLKFAVRVFLF